MREKIVAVALGVLVGCASVGVADDIAYTYKDKDDNGYATLHAKACDVQEVLPLIKKPYLKFFHSFEAVAPDGEKYSGCWALLPDGRVGLILNTGMSVVLPAERFQKGPAADVPHLPQPEDKSGDV